jgi:predicted Zn-dependent peptidase
VLHRHSSQIHLAVSFVGPGVHAAGRVAAQVMAHILGEGFMSRLYTRLREKRGLAYQISSSLTTFSDVGVFAATGSFHPDRIREGVRGVVREIRGMVVVQAHEVRRARAVMRAALILREQSVVYRARDLGGDLILRGRHVPLRERLEELEAVTVRGVQAAARDMLRARPMIAVLGPIQKSLIDYLGGVRAAWRPP